MKQEIVEAIKEKVTKASPKPKPPAKGEKAQCEHCGITITAHNLKYSHPRVCKKQPPASSKAVEAGLPNEGAGTPPPPKARGLERQTTSIISPENLNYQIQNNPPILDYFKEQKEIVKTAKVEKAKKLLEQI